MDRGHGPRTARCALRCDPSMDRPLAHLDIHTRHPAGAAPGGGEKECHGMYTCSCGRNCAVKLDP